MAIHNLLQPTEKIEGIGDKYSKQLHDAGIYTIIQLISTDPKMIMFRNQDISIKLLQKWINQSWLLTIPDVTFDMAECLVDEGVSNIKKLGDKGLSIIEKTLETGVTKNKTNESHSIYKLVEIQKNAIRASNRGVLSGIVLDIKTEKPLSDVEIYCDDKKVKTDINGRFVILLVNEGKQKVRIISETHSPLSLPVEIKANEVILLNSINIPKKTKTKTKSHSEKKFGLKLRVGSSDIITVRKIEVTDLPNDTFLTVHKFYKNGKVDLTHLFRTKVDNVIYTDYLKLDSSILDSLKIKTKDIIHYLDGSFTKSNYSKRQIHFNLLQSKLGKIRSIKRK